MFNNTVNLEKGDWALITGASSGLGAIFARQLAQRGINLILIARRLDLIKSLKGEFEKEHKIQVEAIECDLSKPNWKDSIPNLKTLQVDLLINNAAGGINGTYEKSDFSTYQNSMQLNCMTPAELTHIFLPGMKAKGKGGIIYVSASMGIVGIAEMAQYSAEKAFLINFGESIHAESKGTGVSIQVLVPGSIKTPATKTFEVDQSNMKVCWLAPNDVVENSLKFLGERTLIIPGVIEKKDMGSDYRLLTKKQVQKVMISFAKALSKPADK